VKHYKRPRNRDKSLVLTVRQVMEYLDLSMPSVYAALYRRDFPAEKVGGIWLIKKVPFFERFGWPRGRRPKNLGPAPAASAGGAPILKEDGPPRFWACPLPDASGGLIVPSGRPSAQQRGMPKFREDPEWLSAAQVAAQLGCGRRYVCDRLCGDDLIRYEKHGRVYRFRQEWIDDYRRSVTHLPAA